MDAGPYQHFSLELESTIGSDLNPFLVGITHTEQRRRDVINKQPLFVYVDSTVTH